jgi:hypothetical protein
MTDTREILEAVAAGRLDPAEAARLLDEQQRPASSGDDTGPSAPAVPEVARLLVRATSRKVRLVGDPAVSTVDVDGAHHLRRDGATLVLTGEGERFPADDAFTLLSTGRWRDVADRFGLGGELRVRVRPDLPVDVEVIAGSLSTDGVRALESVRVTAGSARVSGAHGPLDVLVQAGSAVVDAAITRGPSRIRAESGSVRLRLLPGSDVRVRTDVQLGKVVSDPPLHRDELTVGAGSAELSLEVVMGSAVIKVDR